MRNQFEANHQALIESTKDLIWSVGLDYRLITFNRALQQNIEINYGNQIAVGKLPSDFLPPDRVAFWPAFYDRALSEGPFRTEYSLLDGRTLELSFNPILVDGKATGVSVFGKDITERKRFEADLEEARNRYKAIFDGSLEGIFQTSFGGQSLTANPALARMLGYDSPEEIVATVRDSAHEVWVDSEDRSEFLRQLEKQGTVHGYECQYKRKDGTTIWVSLTCRKALAADGKTPINEGFIVDITERKNAEARLRAEQAQRESLEQIQEIIDGATDTVVFLKDADGHFITVNTRFEELLGISRNEIRGKTDYDLVTKDQADSYRAHDQLVLTTGQAIQLEEVALLADGKEHTLLANKFPLLDASGKPYAVCAISADITERKRAEEALREGRAKLEAALDSMTDAVFIADAEGQLVDFNDAFVTYHRFRSRAECGSSISECPKYLEAFMANGEPAPLDMWAMPRALRGETVRSTEYILRSKDTGETWIGNYSFGPIRDDGGAITGAVVTARDITDRKLAEKALCDKSAELAAIQRAEVALRESGDRLKEAEILALSGSSSWDVDSDMTTWSEGLFRIFGRDPDSPAPRHAERAKIYTAESWARLDAAVKHALDTGEPYELEVQFLRSDGVLRWALARGGAIWNEDGRVQRLVGTLQDITERKLAKDALHESETKFHTLSDLVPQLVWMCTPDGMNFYFNHRWVEYTGMTLEESYGQGWNTPFHPEDKQAAWDAWNQAVATGDTYRVESRLRAADGSYHWFLMRGTPLRDDAGQIAKWFGTCTNIDDIKLAEQRLTAALRAQQASETRYRMAFQTGPDAININRFEDGILIDCNQKFVDMTGYTHQEAVGHTILELGIWTRAEDRISMVEDLERDGFCLNREFCLKRKSGEAFIASISASVSEIDGVPIILSFSRDVTGIKLAEQRLAAAQCAQLASEARYRIAFQTSLDAIAITRLSDGVYIEVNQALLEMVGYQREEFIGRSSLEFNIWVDLEDRQRMVEMLTHDVQHRGLEVQFRKKSGDVRLGQISASPIEIDGVPCILSVMRDITEAKHAEEEIKNLAFYDTLTALPNRRLLMERLHQTIAAGAHCNRKCAVLFIDLDDFKSLNDTLGHQTGDLLLKEVARRLHICLRDADMVARLGGDEFVLIIENLAESTEEAASQVMTIAEKVRATVSAPFLFGGIECLCTCSIGITVFGDRKGNIDEILKQADIAMYNAKAAGRNTVCFFASELQEAVNARVVLEGDLRQALKTKQFMLYYQPQITNDQIDGVEALVRWNHPQRGIVPPGDFISVAEETGLILPIGNWVIEKACEQIAAWADRPETSHITVAVNVSAREFRQPAFDERILSVLESTGANAHRLRLELTEGMLLHNFEDVIAKMENLRLHGVRFSLDDFGTGYSSLMYLKRLPLDRIKIDKAFISDITDINSSAIARTIIVLSKAMDLSVIAEGVKTELQREILAGFGCQSFQGHLISPAMPLAQFETWLSEHAAQPITG